MDTEARIEALEQEAAALRKQIATLKNRLAVVESMYRITVSILRRHYDIPELKPTEAHNDSDVAPDSL